MMQGIGFFHGWQIEFAQNVQRFADGRSATGRRSHAEDVVAPVVHLCRCLLHHFVAGQVGGAQLPCGNREGGVFALWRRLYRLGDVGSQFALIESINALLGQHPVGVCEIRILENAPDFRSISAGQEQFARGGERGEPFLVVQGLLAERLVDDKAA
ncbi:hypothetical protein D3C74_288170 [compost metagenome]